MSHGTSATVAFVVFYVINWTACCKSDSQHQMASTQTQSARGLQQTAQLAGSNFTHQSIVESYLSNDELVNKLFPEANRHPVGKGQLPGYLLTAGLADNHCLFRKHICVGTLADVDTWHEYFPLAKVNKIETCGHWSSPTTLEPLKQNQMQDMQLLLGLAEWLCQYRTTDARAAAIVNDMHLYLVPTVNPDGYQIRQRENLGGVDLNRDFPDPLLLGSTGLHPTGDEQPETLALMKWMTNTHFVASASLHEGAVVANYPWDGLIDPNNTYSASPDDSTFRHLASVYANAHTDMNSSKEFAGGITNGAHWYPLTGGMQDWAYVSGQCMELTLEVSQDKWPAAELLPGLFAANLPALLAFPLAAAFSGVRGSVHKLLPTTQGNATDYDTPLQATILVEGIDHPIQAGPLGDFYRPLAPGIYNISAVMKGYGKVSAEIHVPVEGRGVQYNFALPCTTCEGLLDHAQWDKAYTEEGIQVRAAIYAFLFVSGGAWALYALWRWYRARSRSMYFTRRSKATYV